MPGTLIPFEKVWDFIMLWDLNFSCSRKQVISLMRIHLYINNAIYNQVSHLKSTYVVKEDFSNAIQSQVSHLKNTYGWSSSVDGYLLKSSNFFLLHVKGNLLLAYPNFNTHVVIDGLVCPNHLAASVLNKRAATWLQTSPSMWRFKH